METTPSVPSELPRIARNARGPQIENVLRIRDLRSRDRGLERHGERDAEREPHVDERDRRNPPLSHEKE
jgi:hypothetical protein